MIPVSFTVFFSVIIVASLLILLVLWGRMVYRDRAYGWNLSEEELCRCRNCGLIFVGARIEQSVECPLCNSSNRLRGAKKKRRMRY
jgi:hypothetical protein